MLKSYKLNYSVGVRPLVKDDLRYLTLEIIDGEEYIYTEPRELFEHDEYVIVNINTIKSKLLKSMFLID